jgi:hypothetical protein
LRELALQHVRELERDYLGARDVREFGPEHLGYAGARAHAEQLGAPDWMLALLTSAGPAVAATPAVWKRDSSAVVRRAVADVLGLEPDAVRYKLTRA